MGILMFRYSLVLLLASSCASDGVLKRSTPYSQSSIKIINAHNEISENDLEIIIKSKNVSLGNICSNAVSKKNCISYVELPENIIHLVRAHKTANRKEWKHQITNISLTDKNKHNESIESNSFKYIINRSSCFKSFQQTEKYIVVECYEED